MACADDEPGAQVVTAASSERQAGFVFGPIKTLAEESPALKSRVRAHQKRVVHPKSGSYIEVVSSVARTPSTARTCNAGSSTNCTCTRPRTW